ncbi:MAG: HPr family phosphocarrier protein [Deltaproteobacteria bacterium]|nr:HPr family phosphocarrier protein [Deltaproteobacteria bacterium]
MVEFSKKINNKIGLHLRAAGEFVKVAAQFESSITVYNGDRHANGKSILGLASLAAARGAIIRVEVDGPDEKAAQKALKTLFDNNFYED